ncbi:MFS transporter [Alkalicaulis satelles]|uniref:MFS transporter n=1 Tax=Alkalicaulis satelles TaxID=2609175 RepID=A0A5M6ZLN4_9PROT|nr:MFS transporter [Alkalicaulis satelles]KAA5804597.1 MFS transporter [Alkalicaulis satelles]
MTETTAAPQVDSPANSAWTALFMLGVVYLINFMDRQLFAVLQEDIRADLALSDTQLALLGGTMFAVFYATLGLPLAWLADRTNRVRLIAACCAVWSVFTALSGMAAGFWTMAVARIGVASGEAGGVSPSYSVISDYFPAGRRGLAIGLFSIGAPLGIAAGSALGAFIAASLGWRWAFILLGIPGLFAALALVMLVREPRRGRLDGPVKAGPPPLPLDAARAVLASPTLILLTLAAACTSFAGYGMYQWLPSFLIRSQGLMMAEIGQFLAPLFLLGVLGAIGGGWLADRFGRTHPAAYALIPGIAVAIMTPFFLAALMADSGYVSLVLLAIPISLAYAWLGPGLAAVQTLSKAEHRATTAAIIAFFNNLIGIGLGPLAIGAISDWLRNFMSEGEALRYALMAGVVMFILAAGLFTAAAFTLRREIARTP